MTRAVLCLVACLLLAACGGGGNAADAVNAETKYVPDFSTPEGATLAFIRAFETGNAGLLSLTLVDEERDVVLPALEERLKSAPEWALEQVDNEIVADREARSLFKFTAQKDGQPTGKTLQEWVVFVRTADKSWRYSPVTSERYATRRLASELDGKQPDYSTLHGAMAAFIRAVETSDIELLTSTLLEADRAEAKPVWQARFKQSRDEGLGWAAEVMDRGSSPTREARVFKLTELKEGKATGNVVGAWYVFVEAPDGTWRYSSTETTRFMDELKAKSKPPANSPRD
jgi:hypothetical protein